jgi:hypothetical protein
MVVEDLYIATLRAVFKAPSEVDAIMIADQIRQNGERDLELDDGDTIEVSQVTATATDISPQEVLILLKRARNICIKTKFRFGFETGQEIDKLVHILAHHFENNAGYELSDYSYGDFMDTAKEVLAGKNPI